MNGPIWHLGYAATAATALLLLTGCGSAPAAPAAAAPALATLAAGRDLGDVCRAERPQPADRGEAARSARPRWLLVMGRAPGVDVDPAVVDRVVLDASRHGADLLVRGTGLTGLPVVPLAGHGNNPTERQVDRCLRLVEALQVVADAVRSAGPGEPDTLGVLTSGFDALQGLPRSGEHDASSPDTVVVLGQARPSTALRLPGEVTDEPGALLSALGDAGLLRACTGWRFGIVTPAAGGSGDGGVHQREVWRRYAGSCGGALVTWSPTYDGLGTEALPPVAMPAVPATVASRAAGVTTHVLAAQALFAVGSASLSPGAVRVLEPVAAQARQARHVRVVGHADSTGDAAQNAVLSRERAAAVAAHLRAAGVRAPMSVVGRGAAAPVAPDTDTERFRNRRVEIAVQL